nr:unnamed protein product [Callosobruchus chinensis]
MRNELGIEPVLSLIERNQLKWFGHMCRMDKSERFGNLKQCRTGREDYVME